MPEYCKLHGMADDKIAYSSSIMSASRRVMRSTTAFPGSRSMSAVQPWRDAGQFLCNHAII
eukprot:scaffold236562_cov32-Prasinocladus_malaysianus.AAC.2